MITIPCKACRTNMTLDFKTGYFLCPKCQNTLSITELDQPEFGSKKNSSFKINETTTNVDRIYKEASSNNNTNIINQSIPFEVNERKAKKLFKLKSYYNILAKPSYTLDKIQIPSWYFHILGQCTLEGVGTKLKDTTSKELRNTETHYYETVRSVESDFGYRRKSACNTITDEQLDDLGEFDYSSAITIDTPISADRKINEATMHMRKVLIDETTQNAKSYLNEYNSMYYYEGQDQLVILEKRLVLLPLWKFTFRHSHKDWTLLMNGQTGEIHGQIPISIPRLLITITIFTILFGFAGSFILL